MKKIWIIILVLLVVAASAYFLRKKTASSAVVYEYGEITRGNLENLVSSTGTLNTVGSVEVGTQLSGVVDQVLADYNDNVKKGDVLAVLDTLELSISYRTAKSDLNRSKAQYDLTLQKHEDNRKLYEKEYISDLDFQTSLTELITSEASVVSAESALERARIKLENYAVIRSPIDGKVIDRSIDEGQTVAASFSSPVLFLIAQDLKNMEIEAYVDESDIGMIKPGQEARFTVEAYSDEEFTGVVEEIRLQPTTISNVVNYTVIISTTNDKEILLPGMTATIDFVVEQKNDVVLIPSTALKFQPGMEAIKAMMEKRRASRPENTEGSSSKRGDRGSGGPGSREMPADMGSFWYTDSNGDLSMKMVKIGSTDGINTEVTFSRDEIVDLKPIVKKTGGSSSTSSSKDSRNMRMPGMGRM